MSDPRDTRSRLVDPSNSPEKYADPWRGRSKLPFLLVGLGLVVLVWVLVFLLV